MPIYRLTPINLDASNWNATSCKDVLIVRAKNEDSARKLADKEFHETYEIQYRASPTLNSPWLNNNQVLCEEIRESAYEENGPEEIVEKGEIEY